MAANNQGKFWEYHDKLFVSTKALEDADLKRYAEELSLDMAKFEADIASPQLANIVKKHDEQCVSITASGTPAFFVNGRKLSGAKPFAEFKTVIDEELAKAKKLQATGIAPEALYAKILEAGQNVKKASALDSRVNRFDFSHSPSMGPKSAVATMVIFSDFQ